MEHFSKQDWLVYSQGELSEERTALMEQHLTRCSRCLEAFLDSLTMEELEQAERNIPIDFTDGVLAAIKREPIPFPKRKSRVRQKNLFVYYLAVSAITIVLMGNGFFQSLVETVPKVSTPPEQRLSRLNLDWSSKLVDKASTWIYNFETQTEGGYKGVQK